MPLKTTCTIGYVLKAVSNTKDEYFSEFGESCIFGHKQTTKVMRNRYEKSHLSLIEGGSRIKITFKHGRTREYDNIKDVSAYVAKVLSESDYAIDKIEMEKEVVTKEWETLFGRRRFTQTLM